jgi:hypothetical protein
MGKILLDSGRVGESFAAGHDQVVSGAPIAWAEVALQCGPICKETIMTISMYQASVPLFARGLASLKTILTKGAAHAAARKIDESVFLSARLYPDMLPFARQIHIASDFARGTVARLSGSEPPKWEDDEKTFAELIARVDRTIEAVKAYSAAQIDGSEDRPVTRPVRGEPKTFSGINYLLQYSMPNFYFHATTAYAILRSNGVELGKADFIGALD